MHRAALRRGIAVAAAVVLGAAGCGGSDDSKADEDPGALEKPAAGTLAVATLEPGSIEPALSYDDVDGEVVRLLFQSLTSVGTDLKPVAAAAESWVQSSDNTTFTFTLRSGASFTNGRPVVAEDFVYAFNRLADPDLAAPAATRGASILGWSEVLEADPSGSIGDEPVTGVRAIDERTLEIRTSAAFAQLPDVLSDPAFSPVPEEELSGKKAEARFAEAPVGNGAYEIEGSWKHNQSITLRRREGATGPEQIKFVIFSDPQPAFTQLIQGNIDIAEVPLGRVEEAKDTFGDRYVSSAVGAMDYIGFPNEQAPFDNADLRAALSLAIDREAIAERILEGTVEPALGSVPSVLGGLTDACTACGFDEGRAQSLYESSGGLPDDEITLTFEAGIGLTDEMEAIANDWRTVLGVETKLREQEAEAFYGRVQSGKITGAFHLAWVADYPSALPFLAPLFGSDSSDNFWGYVNPELDSLLDQARRAPSDDEANPLLAQAQRLVDDDLPAAPLANQRRVVATSDGVRNVVIAPQGYLLLEQVELVG